MMGQDWAGPEEEADGFPPPDRGMTLLHLTAALGFTRLLFTLLEWIHENPSPIFQDEINPNRVDDFGLIPLVRRLLSRLYRELECLFWKYFPDVVCSLWSLGVWHNSCSVESCLSLQEIHGRAQFHPNWSLQGIHKVCLRTGKDPELESDVRKELFWNYFWFESKWFHTEQLSQVPSSCPEVRRLWIER